VTAAARLPFDAGLSSYAAQALALHAGHGAGDPLALRIMRECLPRFLDPVVRWKPLPLSDDEIRHANLTADDARLALARSYSFRDWDALTQFVTQVTTAASPVQEFEAAVEAVISGDTTTLRDMLTTHPALVHERSTRITCHDPAVHAATLLHYLGANGVEGYRQRSPANAVEVARLLLEAGAAVDALAGMYGGECTTLSMLISSTPPADAGVQVPLVHTLLDYGAAVDGVGTSRWRSPVLTALIFGFLEAAQVLAARGAAVDRLPIAAGLGHVDACRELLPQATDTERHEALALASITHRVDVVALLLDAGESPDRFNPDGMHGHQTPLHGAALSGHMALVQLLVTRGARLNIRDALWNGTPLGWARHAGQSAVVTYLLEHFAVD
jgi:ankyrin repeat protein